MKILKDLVVPITIKVVSALVIGYLVYHYLQEKTFLLNNNKTELVKTYKQSNISINNSIEILKRIEKEVSNNFLIQSEYFINLMDKLLIHNGEFINSQLIIEVYGDSISKPIFNDIRLVLKEIDDTLFEHKKQLELLNNNTISICSENLKNTERYDYLFNQQKIILRNLIARENHLRYKSKFYYQKLECFLMLMQNDFKRNVKQDYKNNMKESYCEETLKKEYLSDFNTKYAYYHIYSYFKNENIPSTNKIVEYYDTKYEKILLNKSMICK